MAGEATHVSYKFSYDQQGYGAGWSENYWANTTPRATLEQALRLGRLLANVHAADVALTHVSLSPVGFAERPILYEFEPHLVASLTPLEWSANLAGDALVVEMSDKVTGEKTRQWIKGIPDRVSEQGQLVFGDNYAKRINGLTAELESGAWSMRKYPRGIPGKTIVGLDIPTGTLEIPAHGYNVMDRVKVRRCRNVEGVNKIWKVMKVTDGDHFQLAGWNPDLHIGKYLANSGTAFPFVMSVITITQVRIPRAANKRVGRPYAMGKGRRKSVRR